MTRQPQQNTALPAFVPPSLAQLADRPPSGDRWIHEIKFDGYRLQLRIQNGTPAVLTREGVDYTSRFPSLVAAVRHLDLRNGIIDGEVVVENEAGVSDIKLLYAAMKARQHHKFVFHGFDLLWAGDRDLRKLPLIDRKAALKRLLTNKNSTTRYCDHFVGDPEKMLQFAAQQGLEGIVSKRADLPYRSGRSTHWIKSKCVGRQEFVVIGFTPSEKASGAVASLALGYYSGGELVYAGRVGTGFSAQEAAAFSEGLSTIRIPGQKCRNVPADHVKETRWIRPMFVAEIEFRGWTAGGLLWHPAFKVLRDDKPAEQVVFEEAGERFIPPGP